MGQYVINGKVVDLREDLPTAADVKRAVHGPSTDWVMATKPGGEIVRVPDTEVLPAGVQELAIVPPYQYGRRS
jgi:hypothetical protein